MDSQDVISAVARHADLRADLSILDAGTSEDFAQAILERAPNAHLVVLEKTAPRKEIARAQHIASSIETCAFETERFDVIVSRHASPDILADHWRTLKTNGLLILEAPHMAADVEFDVIEQSGFIVARKCLPNAQIISFAEFAERARLRRAA